MEELINTLANSNLTWPTAFVIVMFILRAVPTGLIELAKSRQETNIELERARIATENKKNEVLDDLKNELVLSRGIYNQLITNVTAVSSTVKNVANTLSDKQTEIHNDVKVVPQEVWRLGDQRLSSLKKGFEDYINSLEQRIIEKLPPDATNAQVAIRHELDEIKKRVDDINHTITVFTKPIEKEKSDGNL